MHREQLPGFLPEDVQGRPCGSRVPAGASRMLHNAEGKGSAPSGVTSNIILAFSSQGDEGDIVGTSPATLTCQLPLWGFSRITERQKDTFNHTTFVRVNGTYGTQQSGPFREALGY